MANEITGFVSQKASQIVSKLKTSQSNNFHQCFHFYKASRKMHWDSAYQYMFIIEFVTYLALGWANFEVSYHMLEGNLRLLIDMIACCQLECYSNYCFPTPIAIVIRDPVSNKAKVWCVRKVSNYFRILTLNQMKYNEISLAIPPSEVNCMIFPHSQWKLLWLQLLFQFCL